MTENEMVGWYHRPGTLSKFQELVMEAWSAAVHGVTVGHNLN